LILKIWPKWFHKIDSQQQQLQQQLLSGKVPPQIPPKPFSRSTSRERLKDDAASGAANAIESGMAALDDELRTILSGGGRGFTNGSGIVGTNVSMYREGNAGPPAVQMLGKQSCNHFI
jgi:hypothetical protein